MSSPIKPCAVGITPQDSNDSIGRKKDAANCVISAVMNYNANKKLNTKFKNCIHIFLHVYRSGSGFQDSFKTFQINLKQN